MRLCEHGCGQEAIHQFKNGRWCCNLHQNKCPALRNKMKLQPHRKEKRSEEANLKHSITMKKNKLSCGEKNGMFGKYGKLNSFYGKTHTLEQRKKWKKERSTNEYKQMMSKIMKKLWTEKWFIESHTKWSKEEIKNLKQYYKAVGVYTRTNYRLYKHIINPQDKKIGYRDYHIDHKFSIINGFKNDIDSKIIGSVVNLQVLYCKENMNKSIKSCISLDELLKGFSEHENNI
jgi:hypothetical protein